ncbi:MAG: hypothetical protein ACKOCT_08590 [Alphaproteobacteria bacterium]
MTTSTSDSPRSLRALPTTAVAAILLAVSLFALAGCPARRAGTPSVLDPTMLDRA